MNEPAPSPPAALLKVETLRPALVQPGKLTRHGLAFALGLAAANGYGVDASTAGSLCTSFVLLVLVTCWSALTKTAPEGSNADFLHELANAATRHVLPALAGWLATKHLIQAGADVGGMAPQALLMLAASYFLSARHAPDGQGLKLKAVDPAELGGQHKASTLPPGSGGDQDTHPYDRMPKLPHWDALPLAALLCGLLLSSCSVGPMTKEVWLGGSFMAKSSHDLRTATLANGTSLTWDRSDPDETAVAHDYLRYGMIKSAIGASKSVLNTATKTSAHATTTAAQASPVMVGGAVGAGVGALSSGSKPQAATNTPATAPAAASQP